jgi:hypothetical protein
MPSAPAQAQDQTYQQGVGKCHVGGAQTPPRANNTEVIPTAVQAVAGRAENSTCHETRFPNYPLHLKEHYNRRWRACHYERSDPVRDP